MTNPTRPTHELFDLADQTSPDFPLWRLRAAGYACATIPWLLLALPDDGEDYYDPDFVYASTVQNAVKWLPLPTGDRIADIPRGLGVASPCVVKTPCVSCNGTGDAECSECGQDCDCPDCDGIGEFEDDGWAGLLGDKPAEIEIAHDRYINEVYLRLLSAAGFEALHQADIAIAKGMAFAGTRPDGARYIVMGMNPRWVDGTITLADFVEQVNAKQEQDNPCPSAKICLIAHDRQLAVWLTGHKPPAERAHQIQYIRRIADILEAQPNSEPTP